MSDGPNAQGRGTCHCESAGSKCEMSITAMAPSMLAEMERGKVGF